MRIVSVVLATLLGLPLLVQAAPKAELWERWRAHDEQSTMHVDHTAWDAFLQRYVRESDDYINRVAYREVTEADRKSLDAYLQQLQAVAVSQLARDEQRAYWINLYNATTIATVLDHYPVPSILKIDISPGLLARGPWGNKLLKIENEAVSLDDIEHRILRPIWRDPRTHYALNCASLGCPNLQRHAYTADRLGEMLAGGAREYVNHPRGARVVDGKLIVSSIYIWFKDDFGGNDAGVIKHLERYGTHRLNGPLATIRKISDHEYDWALNEVR